MQNQSTQNNIFVSNMQNQSKLHFLSIMRINPKKKHFSSNMQNQSKITFYLIFKTYEKQHV